jgi:hypothetical protein
MRHRLLLVPLLVAGLATSASAGIIFGKKPKVVPEKRVPELLSIVMTDGDENKRYDAVAELRDYDPKQFPQIVPTLIEVLMNDKKPSVRSETAQTLAKLRPVSEQVAQALKYARDKDPSLRVRMQARSSLLSYEMSLGWWWGDRGKLKPDGPPPSSTQEPPLAPPGPPVTTLKPKPDPLPPPVIVTPPPPVVPPRPVNPQPIPQASPSIQEKGPELPPQE